MYCRIVNFKYLALLVLAMVVVFFAPDLRPAFAERTVKATPTPIAKKKTSPKKISSAKHTISTKKSASKQTPVKSKKTEKKKQQSSADTKALLASPEFKSYRDEVKAGIKSKWKWKDHSKSIKATALFRISSTGQLTEAQIDKSSGNVAFDKSVLDAIAKASPLKAAPAKVYPLFKVARLEFDSAD